MKERLETRPFDLLQDSLGKNVLVELKDRVSVRGNLKAYDIHMNLVLEGAETIVDGAPKNRYGKMLLRGDNVLLISP